MGIIGYWADLKSSQVNALPSDCIAVLPLGATEQHGPHLPLSVDTDLTAAVASRALGHLRNEQNVLILPTLSITKSNEHDRFPGTLSLSADALLAVLRDIGASIARTNVQRLVLFNGHGGNTALLDVVARDLRIRHDLIVVTCSWFSFADRAGFASETRLHDIHAGDFETSAMLAAHPDKVEMDQARNFRTAMQDWAEAFPDIGLSGQPARPSWIAGDLNPHGACGDASAATAEKGEHLLDTAAQNFAKFLGQFATFDHRAGGR